MPRDYRSSDNPRVAMTWLEALYQKTSRGVVLLEAGTVIAANAAAPRILGLDQLVGQPWATVCRLTLPDGSDLPDREHPILLAERDRQPCQAVMLGLRGDDGARRLLQVEAIPVLAGQDMPVQVVCIFAEIDARHDREDAILYDPLTGLVNGVLFRDRLRHALVTAQRAQGPLALLLLTLGRFEEARQVLGPAAGDLLLQEVSNRLRLTLRDSDTVGRLGDDRFVMLLPTSDPAGALRAVHRILPAVQQSYLLEGQRIELGARIGIAFYPEHGKDGATLLNAAEEARVTAIQGNRDYAIHAAGQEHYSPPRLALAGELHQAIGKGQLLLQYLPRVEMRTGALQGLEVLLCWRHPQRGDIPAGEFMPLAEQMGLVDALTWWTLETALRQRRDWRHAGRDVRLAITLPLHTLHDPQLPKSIGALLGEYDLPVGLLTLEVSRGSLMTDSTRNIAMLARLAEAGVHLTLDNFGVEYTPLAYLRRLPVHEVKIAGSLVRGMGAGAPETETVRSIIELCHDLGLRVVADGVENQRVWDLLLHLHCDRVQGPYLSAPLPAADLERRLATTSVWNPLSNDLPDVGQMGNACP